MEAQDKAFLLEWSAVIAGTMLWLAIVCLGCKF